MQGVVEELPQQGQCFAARFQPDQDDHVDDGVYGDDDDDVDEELS